MIKLKKPVAYTKLDKQNEFFSAEALKEVCKTTKLPLIITEGFSFTEAPVGKVTNLEFKKDRLIATIELKDDIIIPETVNNYCFRVGGALKKSIQTKIGGTILATEIKEIELIQIGLISKTEDVYESEDE